MKNKTSTKKTRKLKTPKPTSDAGDAEQKAIPAPYIDEFGRIQNPNWDEMIAELNKKHPPEANT
jgi:hypothetical protein